MAARAALAARWIGLALVPLALAGCGNQTVQINAHELHLSLQEYRFVPQSTSVPPGPLTVIAHNDGLLTHNLVIEISRHDTGGNPIIVAAIPTILPGRTAQAVNLDLPPGHYTIASTIANQADLGMTGSLIVRGR